MLNYGSNTIDTLFKYAPKCISNNKICPKELVGKIPIKPDRTRFKLGIYLTSCRNLYSRYMEDHLSIGYSPNQIYSIDVNQLLSLGYKIIDNEDKEISPISVDNLKNRVWPAYGQVGGASELIAIPSQKDTELPLEEPIDIGNVCIQSSNNCPVFQPSATMQNAPRYQIFAADTVSLPANDNLNKSLNFFRMILLAYREEGLFEDKNAEETFFKVTDSGLVIKSSLNGKNITLSAGLKVMDKYCYAYIIGAEWFDCNNSSGEIHRILMTTSPSIFHWSCNKQTKFFPPELTNVLKSTVEDIKSKIYSGTCTTSRIVKLPTL